jgi:hypothetical protein
VSFEDRPLRITFRARSETMPTSLTPSVTSSAPTRFSDMVAIASYTDALEGTDQTLPPLFFTYGVDRVPQFHRLMISPAECNTMIATYSFHLSQQSPKHIVRVPAGLVPAELEASIRDSFFWSFFCSF